MTTLRLLMLRMIPALCLSVSALATPTDFIIETVAGADPRAIARDYSILLKDVAPGGAPFALYTADSSRIDGLEGLLGKDPRVAWADVEEQVGLTEPDTTSRGGTIPVIGSIDHLDAENANLLVQIHWSSVYRTQNLRHIRVAVLDTGVSPYATTLMARSIRIRSQLGPSLSTLAQFDLPDLRYSLDSVQNQSVGHGTMVAGLIAEIAPNADFIFEKVADGSGIATSWSVIRGLADAVASNADMVNISLGAPGPVIAFEQAFGWVQSKGVLVVAPAGNNNQNGLLEPAALDGVVGIVGVDANDVKADFSNWGSQAAACAPAVGIRSINWDGKMAIWSGTSFSAPLVTGALSLALGSGLPVNTSSVYDFLNNGGDSVDSLNPLYSGKLGKRLDIAKLLIGNTQRVLGRA